MKRQVLTRDALAQHEAAHLVAIAMLERPTIFCWRHLNSYEIAHAEAPMYHSGSWENSDERNEIIARNAVIALAGGAGDACSAGVRQLSTPKPDEVYYWTGAVDFELAHEWLTLQRYDGSQRQIEADLCRLFAEVCQMLSMPKQRRACTLIAYRIIELLHRADQSGIFELREPAGRLVAGVELDAPPRFMLCATT